MSEFNVPLQIDGWPVGMFTEDKGKTVTVIREVLQNAPHSLETDQVRRYAKDKLNQLPSWKGAVLLDWQYAALDRALREIAFTVWVLKSEHL